MKYVTCYICKQKVRACVRENYWITGSLATWCTFLEIGHPLFPGLDPPMIYALHNMFAICDILCCWVILIFLWNKLKTLGTYTD